MRTTSSSQRRLLRKFLRHRSADRAHRRTRQHENLLARERGEHRLSKDRPHRRPARTLVARVYRKVWEMTAFAAFLTAREAAKAMVPRGRGTMLFTGPTAS